MGAEEGDDAGAAQLHSIQLGEEPEVEELHHEAGPVLSATEGKPRVSVARLLLVSMINIGITFGYNAEFILGTPLFSSLG